MTMGLIAYPSACCRQRLRFVYLDVWLMLEQALHVIDRWALLQDCGFAWIKANGSEIKSEPATGLCKFECCLLATRGHPAARRRSAGDRRPPREHSRKPGACASGSKRLVAGPYLNCSRARHGRISWGDEVGKFDEAAE